MTRSFTVSKEEHRVALEWILTHKCKARRKDHNPSCSWVFTPTGIGTCVEISCVCGAKFDATDYNMW